MQKLKRICVLILSALLILGCSFSSYADVNDLLIATGSNARTFAMPRSSVGTVKNTVAWDNGVVVFARFTDGSVLSMTNYLTQANSNGLGVKYSAPSGKKINAMFIYLRYGAFNYMPANGTYNLSFDVASQFGHSYSAPTISSIMRKNHVADTTNSYYLLNPNFTQSSGDLYAHDVIINYTGSQYVNLNLVYPDPVENVDFTMRVNFTASTANPMYTTAGTATIDSDYQEGISSSISDISSSVDSMTDEISGITEAIENLQGAMEPHYNNVLQQMHHITEQLHAFYDQVYNNIHLAQMNVLNGIKSAIENLDIDITVDFDGLKTSINNMSTAVQNKLQSVSDTITGGYDNSGMESENNELSGAVDELDQAEKEVLDDVSGYIEGFEYPSFDGISSGIIGALSFLGGFLHSMFLSMGSFGLVITFSLTMIFVLIIVGYHRIRS